MWNFIKCVQVYKWCSVVILVQEKKNTYSPLGHSLIINRARLLLKGAMLFEKSNKKNRLTCVSSPLNNRPRGYETFLCSTQLSMKLVMLINIKLLTIANSFLVNTAEHKTFSANKYNMPTIDGIFIVISYWQRKSHAHLRSMKKFSNIGACLKVESPSCVHLLSFVSNQILKNKRQKYCLWKQRTHYGLENESLDLIETLHKQ